MPPSRARLLDFAAAAVAMALAVLIYRGWRGGLVLHLVRLPWDAPLTDFAHAHRLPAWVRFSLPDALWQYAFAATMHGIWRGAHPSASIRNFSGSVDAGDPSNGDVDSSRVAFWAFAPLVFGVGVELGQAAGVLAGTFDGVDLALSVAAAALAFLVHGPVKSTVWLVKRRDRAHLASGGPHTGFLAASMQRSSPIDSR